MKRMYQALAGNLGSMNELTWQSHTGLSQSSQPSRQFSSQGQSKLVRFKLSSTSRRRISTKGLLVYSDIIYHFDMQYFLWNIDSSRHYHHWDNLKCTRLKWFRNDPCKQHLNPEPWNRFWNYKPQIQNYKPWNEFLKALILTNNQWMDQNRRVGTWPGSVCISKRRISFFWNSLNRCAVL